jgi:polyphosphate kinase
MKESLFVNRELSWMEFNRRVLEEAMNDEVPLLERVKFLAIFSSNLDEFFMVRIARLKRRIREGDLRPDLDGMTPPETVRAISETVRRLSARQHACFLDELLPRLEGEGIHVVRQEEELGSDEQNFLHEFFHRTVFPVVTPLAIDPGHPFPYLANRGLCLVAALKPASRTASALPDATLSVVHTPAQVVPRFIQIPSPPAQYRFMLLEDLLRMYLPELYQGYEILSCHALRVTRDAEFETTRIRSDDLLQSIEQGIKQRRMGDAVRLQYDANIPENVLSLFVEDLELTADDLYPGKGFTAFTDLFQLYAQLNLTHLKDRLFTPVAVKQFEGGGSIWSAIRHSDVLVQHPYNSFDAVARFVDDAAKDPNVLAIKMTLYRTSPTSAVVQALRMAAESGKEVAVLLELQARFDEEANISWARTLENVGAHVVYGIVGLKTHCKLCLVVRKEASGIRRYCHLGTGNYNARTAAIYSDFGLFTCRENFGEDLSEVFNLLTGYTRQKRLRNLVAAPTDLRDMFVARIQREAAHARAGKRGRIIAKVNSVVDPRLIEELYAASQAGVEIDIICRGICCLRPQVSGISDKIRVRSIIDRYLEHARVFYFANDGQPEYFLASADWMPRNLDRRVEVAFPVLDPALQKTIDAVLAVQLADNTKAWTILADGTSERVLRNGAAPVRSQEEIYSILRHTSDSYEPADGLGLES